MLPTGSPIFRLVKDIFLQSGQLAILESILKKTLEYLTMIEGKHWSEYFTNYFTV